MCICGYENMKRQQWKKQQNKHNFKRLYFMFVNRHICVVLQSSVHKIGSWNHPKIIHKSKCTLFLSLSLNMLEVACFPCIVYLVTCPILSHFLFQKLNLILG